MTNTAPNTDFTAGLNPEQKQAVNVTNGPLLIMAGAGSGKTRVLTHRIARLVSQEHISPYNILAITFTNKAANEMKQRVMQLVPNSKSLWISTFHSLALRILKNNAQAVGLSESFSVISPDEQGKLMKQILDEMAGENMDVSHFNKNSALGMISRAKDEMLTSSQVKDTRYNQKFMQHVTCYGDMLDVFAELYRRYQIALRQMNGVDFDDLIFKTTSLLQNNPIVLEQYQNRFQYINVDEYQDTNHAQYLMVSLLAARFHNVAVVGDADQAIYGWRGADISNILNFQKDYPEAISVTLEQNYRSTPAILKAANDVIAHNQQRKPKNLRTENTVNTPVFYTQYANGAMEAENVASRIALMKEKSQQPYSSFAILYRNNSLSRQLEDAFLHRNIPYKIIGGLRFYDREEIKDLLAYLRLINNPKDNLAFQRIVNKPHRGIGLTSIARLSDYTHQIQAYSLYEALPKLLDALKDGTAKVKIGKNIIPKLADFYNLIESFRQYAVTDDVDMHDILLKVIQKTEYMDMLKHLPDNEASESKIDNVNQLLQATEEFDSQYDDILAQQLNKAENDPQLRLALIERGKLDRLNKYLTEVAPIGDQPGETEDADSVRLMTMHAAKGLEFPVVFLIGIEENILPTYRIQKETDPNKAENLLEEERRLMYVAITRAQYALYISSCNSRSVFGNFQPAMPSRFLSEISTLRKVLPIC